MQLLLLQDPRAISVQETHVFSEWIGPLIERTRADRARGRNVSLSALFDDEELLDVARSLFDSIVDRALRERPDASVFVEKTPSHVRHGATIVELYPDARFIEVVRDPRAAAASLIAASRTWARSWAPSDAVGAARLWRADVRAGAGLRDLTPQVVRVRYEDLTSDGPATLLGVMQLLGLPADHDHCQRLFELCAAGRVGDGRVEKPIGMKGDVAGTVRNAAAGGWREELDRADIRTIETICSAEMAELGYEPMGGDSIVPPLPLVTGSAKAAVRRALTAVATASTAAAGKVR